MKQSGTKWWAWLWFVLGALYFLVPLYATFDFSLRMERGVLGFKAYQVVLSDERFWRNFSASIVYALITIVVSFLLVVPTAYWVNLRLPRLRPIVEFVTLMPFVIPAIVLVFGIIQTFGRPLRFGGLEIPALTGTQIPLIAGYMVLSFPYIYRAVDTGLRTIDVRTLTEAAQSLGANTFQVLMWIIFPCIRSALLSGALLTISIVIGEFTFASLLVWPAFGIYMQNMGANRAYEPAALAIISFILTWGTMALLQYLTRNAQGQGQVAGVR